MTRSTLWPDPSLPWDDRLHDFRDIGYHQGEDAPSLPAPIVLNALPLFDTRGMGPNGGFYGWSWAGGVIEEHDQSELVRAYDIRFPAFTKGLHHDERGRNAVEFRNCTHCYIVLKATNVELGAYFRDCHYCTVIVEIDNSAVTPSSEAYYGTTGLTYHHGVYDRYGSHNRYIFKTNSRGIHDVSYAAGTNTCEFVVDGPDIALDGHGLAPSRNLFRGNVGAGTRVWVSGGPDSAMPHTGPGNIYWGLRKADGSPVSYLPPFGTSGRKHHPDFICVGHTQTLSGLTHVEAIPPAQLDPQDLRLAQRGENQPEPPGDPMPKFDLGDAVKATSQVNVRSSPGIQAGNLIGTQPLNATGTVMEGPVPATGFIYWRIDFGSGVDGWVGEDRLVEVPPIPAPTVDEQIRAYFLDKGWSDAMVDRVLQ